MIDTGETFQTYEATTMNEGKSNGINQPLYTFFMFIGIHLDTSADLNFTKLRTEFADAIYDIYDAMSDAPSLRDLMNYLYRGYEYLRPQLSHCKNKADVFNLISEYISLINVNLLEAIVNKFHIEAAKPVIHKCKENIRKIQQSVLHQVLNQSFYAGSPLQSETIKIFVKHDVQICKFNEVEQIITAAFRKNERYVRIVVIKEGSSYIVTCSFPLLLSEKLISTALDNIETLEEKGVQRLTIGFSTVYDNEVRAR